MKSKPLSRNPRRTSPRSAGIIAALASAFFLGLAPVFGKQAINLGLSPYAVVAMRTTAAALVLLLFIWFKKRAYLYIYPAGLLGCMLAGSVNGLGSVFYYASLGRINASLGQLLYSLYPIFVLLWMWLDGQRPSHLTMLRVLILLPGIYLLTQANSGKIDLIGMGMMLISSILYALHIPINQRVLYDMPAPTVTLYTLLSMSVIVVPAFVISAIFFPASRADYSTLPLLAWGSVLGLTIVTVLSRLTLFFGIKNLGGMQATLLGLGELLIAILFSHWWLGEKLTLLQWIGAFLLTVSLFLVAFEKRTSTRPHVSVLLSWLRPPGLPKDIPWPPN